MFFSYLICSRQDRNIPGIYRITIAYLLTQFVLVICFRQLGAHNLSPQILTYLISTVCFATAVALIFCVGATKLWDFDCYKIITILLPAVGLIGAVLWLVFGIKIIPHASSTATVIAVSMVYFIPRHKSEWPRALIIPILIAAIIKLDASSPLGVACVTVFAYFYLNGCRRAWLVLALVPLLVGVLYYGPERILDDGARFEAYRVFMGYWWRDDWTAKAFGYGLGAFETLSQPIQYKAKFLMGSDGGRVTGWLWLHMHSDWLQFLWEYGIVGFTLVLASAITLYRHLVGYPTERAILLG